ncbi:hypothetical protein [Clostridium sp. E02]|uniref:hypothetical protein n=1 Tax=Clostridium sp. E02 TaxID=2487134 RepID=UPI000F544137|nr:hypothetical protein [Clostridium sp. E02]
MKERLLYRIRMLEKKISEESAYKSITSKRRSRKIIPEEYFIEVITTIPERKTFINYDEL